MSYDLAVFDPTAAPRNEAEFTKWYDDQTEWKEPHDYKDPSVSSPALRAWFMSMIQIFPAMNGPYARDEDVVPRADYSVGHSIIYVGFAPSTAGEAYKASYRLAAKHGVGFIDVSSDDSDVLFPDGDGELVRAFSLLADDD